MGHAVGSRRTLEKDERWGIRAAPQRFVVDIVVVPKLQDFLLKRGKTGAAGQGAKGANRSGHGSSGKGKSAVILYHLEHNPPWSVRIARGRLDHLKKIVRSKGQSARAQSVAF